MQTRHTLIATALILSSAACTTAGAAGDMAASGASADRERTARFSADELVNTGGWTLQSATAANGAAIGDMRPADVTFDMHFSDGQVNASGGCNQLRGDYKVVGKHLELNLPIVTRMSCTDEKNLADRRFSERMSRAFKVELLEPQPYRLRLTSDDGDVMVFQAEPISL